MSVTGYLTGKTEEQKAESEEREVDAEELEMYRSVEDYDPVLRAHCRL
jgi:hypothetical protein